MGLCIDEFQKAERQLRRNPVSMVNGCSECLKKQQKIDKLTEHLGIRRIQDIFVENEERLYHWADNRSVPAENNLAERDLRPTVIARKVSFGSQSDAGAHTRSVLMTVLNTIKKRGCDVAFHFKCEDAVSVGSNFVGNIRLAPIYSTFFVGNANWQSNSTVEVTHKMLKLHMM